MLKKLCLLSLLFSCAQWMWAQTSSIDSIAAKYRNWLTGEGVNYSNTSVNDRYVRFRNSGNGARNLTGYNFASPGPVWNLAAGADQSAYVTLVEQKLIRLVFLYQLKGPVATPNPDYHSAGLRDTILNIFDYLKAKGINDTTNFNMDVNPGLETVDINNSVALRSSAYATAIFLMKDELITAGAFGHHMDALGHLTSFLGPGNPDFNFTYPGFNTDVVRAMTQQRLCYVLAQDDTSSTRVSNMAYLKNFIDNALLTGYGWSDCIKPDGITYHHRGAYSNTYGADALHQASILNLVLKNTAYQLNTVSEQNVKNAVMTYRRFSIDFTMPRGLAGRFPNNTNALDALRPALAYLYLADPAANTDAGQEFIRLWNISSPANTTLQRANVLSINMVNSLGGMQDMVDVLNAGLTPSAELTEGQFGFPYAGLSVHKYNGWQTSVKGTSKHIWHFENGATENLLGAYTSAGAMELLARGNPVTPDSNGLSFAGWDWAHIPGTTVANVPFATMANFVMRQMNGKNFLAHAALDSNGVFAMDYRDINSTTGMTALKTYFFFKDKILCLGSDIKDVNGTYPIHTTLFQTSFAAGNTSLVNGIAVSGNTYTFSQTGGGLWATDAAGNGFVVPVSPYNTSNITIQRATQITPTQNNMTTDTGNFVKAYIDHGTAPAAGTYQYGIQVQGGSAAAGFLANFNNYFSILKQDSQAHIVEYVPDSIYSYVVFDTTITPAFDLLQKTDKPAVIMTQQLQQGDKVKVSLTNPNLGLLATNETYTLGQISGTASRLYRVPQTDTVKITLRGQWQLESPQPHVSVTTGDSLSYVYFSTKNGIAEQATLVRTVPLPLNITSFRVRTRDCAAVLEWAYHKEDRDTRSIAVERSSDGQRWEQLALLPPDVQYFRDAAAFPAFYRLAAYNSDQAADYSPVLYAGSFPDCTTGTINIYPNPVTDRLHIEAEQGTVLSKGAVRIIDRYGRGQEVTIAGNGSSICIDMKKLPAGLYLVLVNNRRYKVVKQ